MGISHFNIFVSGVTSSVEDWQKAMGAPKGNLPKLNEEQAEIARRMGMSAEEYARGLLVFEYGERRQKERGEKLGKKVEEILGGIGEPYKLEAVIREGTKGRWVARIETPSAPKNVAVAMDLADDLIDSDTVQDEERLKVLILHSLGKQCSETCNDSRWQVSPV
jgi:hypothetical protein